MLKIKTFLLTLALACIVLLGFTAFQYRDDFKDRSMSNLSNSQEDTGGMLNNLFAGGVGHLNDLWQGDTHVVMGKMGNETLRAQLGRRTWYFLHVMASRYPEEPTKDETQAMKSFLFLMSRLYPCGDCAHHFQQHIKRHPLKVGSRDELEQYLCSMHNVVNRSLKKTLFDCSTVHDAYDCGCGPDNVRYKPPSDR